MEEIVKVNQDTQTISGRDLHEALGIKERFSLWAERQGKMFGEEITFVGVPTEVANNGGVQIRELQDFTISVENAKHICLMAKTEKGKQCRQYLIDLEKAWNTPEQIMARALKVAEQTIQGLSQQVIEQAAKIEEMAPKVTYLDTILASTDSMLVTQIAQDYGMSAKAFNKLLSDMGIQRKVGGQWILYSEYQGKGYVHSHTYTYEKSNGQQGSSSNTEWTQKGRLFLYEELKENGIVPEIEKEVA